MKPFKWPAKFFVAKMRLVVEKKLQDKLPVGQKTNLQRIKQSRLPKSARECACECVRAPKECWKEKEWGPNEVWWAFCLVCVHMCVRVSARVCVCAWEIDSEKEEREREREREREGGSVCVCVCVFNPPSSVLTLSEDMSANSMRAIHLVKVSPHVSVFRCRCRDRKNGR